MKLGYVVLFVPDVARAVAFYERAFGLTRGFANEKFAQMATGEVALAFGAEDNERSELPAGFEFHANRPEASPAGIQVSFVSDDVEAAFGRAVDAGATPVVAPQRMPWGQVVSRVRDLDGVLVSLVSPPPGR
ncbi:MAG TPA: VOC family protein [Kofleriaceae bacterium]|nr:VOC family protein [Kofleriaceae bacterium]